MTAKLHLGKCLVEVVDAGNRLRSVDSVKVAMLAESIAAIGLQQPISIWSPSHRGSYLIIARSGGAS